MGHESIGAVTPFTAERLGGVSSFRLRLVAFNEEHAQGGAVLTRTIRTNSVVGGLAAAVLGLGLAIGAANQTPAHAAPAPAATVVSNPEPVAGLDETQMNNAKKIVETAREMGLGERAAVIAVATAMQESNLHNLASTTLVESYGYTGEGEGSDHDSVGLFQQRQNWGKTKDLMTPQTSTRKFLEALKQVPGWEKLPLTVAAQQVQVSAYPDAYAKHENRATQIVDALNK
ncbi:MAG TPA: hypothetical protein VFC19_38780 [Candidatus Limnocylindrales bacterium]|nr:hypothetical protein [Candidatus Limnocylindrales bacterium]